MLDYGISDAKSSACYQCVSVNKMYFLKGAYPHGLLNFMPVSTSKSYF
jgi:hypothetical protein